MCVGQCASANARVSANVPWELDALDASRGQWWTYPAGERSFSASEFFGAEESIAAVEAAIARGGHVGILGFSQGAMLAAVVAMRAERSVQAGTPSPVATPAHRHTGDVIVKIPRTRERHE